MTDTSLATDSGTTSEPAKSKPGNGRHGIIPLALAAVLAAGVLLWSGANAYRLSLVTLTVSYALIALGMYVPVAWARSLSLAYGAYAAIGAYSVAVVGKNLGLPIWAGWIAGVIVAVAVAVLLALTTARLRGFYLVAATLLFASAFETWLEHNLSLGSSNGLVGVPDLSLFGWVPPQPLLVLAGVVAVLLAAFAIDRVRHSRWGVLTRSVGEIPVVVSSSGTSVAKTTVVVLALGAAVAALGGAFFVTVVGGITPETFSLNIVFLALFMPLLGGIGTPWGAVLGAVLTVQLTVQWTVFADGGGLLVLSVAVMVVLLAAPRGLLGYLSALTARVTTRRKAGSDE